MAVFPAGTFGNGGFVQPNFITTPLQVPQQILQLNTTPAAFSGGLSFLLPVIGAVPPNIDSFDDIFAGPLLTSIFNELVTTSTGQPVNAGTIPTQNAGTNTTLAGLNGLTGLTGGNNTAAAQLAAFQQQQAQQLAAFQQQLGLGGGTATAAADFSNPFGNLGGLGSISNLTNQTFMLGGQSFRLVPA